MTEGDGFFSSAEQLFLSDTALVELMQEVLSKDRIFRFQAKGFSMSPFVLDGDLISISPLSISPLKFGEVVAYTHPLRGKLIVHRIVSHDQDGYQILGDNQLEPEYDAVPPDKILGRVTGIERNGQMVKLGLGPERSLIAVFSRNQLLQPLISLLILLVHPMRRLRT
jgi:signal peptidase I